MRRSNDYGHWSRFPYLILRNDVSEGKDALMEHYSFPSGSAERIGSSQPQLVREN